MPTRPPSPCLTPGCPLYATAGGYCATHQRNRARFAAKPDSEANRIRSSIQWRRLRNWYRATHPLCCDPFGEHKASPVGIDDVHHIFSIESRPDMSLDVNNLAALCRRCHSRVEQMERAGKSTAGLFASI